MSKETEATPNDPVESMGWFDQIMDGLKKERLAINALHKAGRITGQRANGHLDGINGAEQVALRVRARMRSNA